jgi:hypothetical protein
MDMSESIWLEIPSFVSMNREFAEIVRPHNPELADLYVRFAEVNEAIRKHLTQPR